MRTPTDAEIVFAVEALDGNPFGAPIRPPTAFLVGYLGMGDIATAVRRLGPKLSSLRRRGHISGERAAHGRRAVVRWGPA